MFLLLKKLKKSNMFNIESMKTMALRIIDPKDPYSQEDFNNEFGGVQTSNITTPDFRLKLNIINESSNELPNFATVGSSGLDLRANLVEPMTIKSGKRAIVPTGLFFEIPQNFEIQIRPRSGLAAKNGVTVLNSPGTIDSDYQGEVKIILINFGDEDFVVNHGDRIAQAIFSSVLGKKSVNISQITNMVTKTERGFGGFGSTGK